MTNISELKIVNLKETTLLSLFALVIGLVVGVIDFIFGKGLLDISAFRDNHLIMLLPFLGFGGLLIVYLYNRFGGKAKAGMGLIFDVGHAQEEDIPLVLIPLVIFSTWLTHLFGGSAGREGVAVQIGATLSHYFAPYTKNKDLSKPFLLIGMSAGFAGLFQTPLAAIVFALEILVLDSIKLNALIPMTLAALTASATSHRLGLEKFSVAIGNPEPITLLLVLKLALLGLLFAVAGNVFAYLLSYGKNLLAERFPNPYLRIAVMGLLLSLLLFLFYQGRYSGLGTNLIQLSFTNHAIKPYDWFFKLFFTVVTIAAGFQGGEVPPLFSIGASLGIVLAPIFGLPLETVAALGYISVFSSATNTFLAPFLIGFEVFGPEHFLYYFIVLVFAYSIDRKHSIYPKQKLQLL
ncbi:voltage-gated chloride channel family protein [Streptococcus uberis]